MVVMQPKYSFDGHYKKGVFAGFAISPSNLNSYWFIDSSRFRNQKIQTESYLILSCMILSSAPKRWRNLTDLTRERKVPSAGTLLMLPKVALFKTRR